MVLVDAPAVLGWTRWTEIGNRYNIGMVRALLSNAVETGPIPPQPIGATVSRFSARCVKRRSTWHWRKITTWRAKKPAW
jgi:Tetracyclin repressor-like, C-terminal domain